MEETNTAFVACWGNATSYTDQVACRYAKDITLRYPIKMCFAGKALRLRFSNLTGTETVNITECYIAKAEGEPLALSVDGKKSFNIEPGCEVESDALPIDIERGETIDVSMYLGNYTQMNAGTLITGPLSKGQYAYGNHAKAKTLPMEATRSTNWFYFLNTIDILTSADNYAIVCYGDSITAQSWPDHLSLLLEERGIENASVIRRAVSGSRILRQYDCVPYQAYGLKGATRFPIEMRVAGAKHLIIQHGINDIIHPVGVEVNAFRPWSDLPTVEELQQGVEDIYVKPAKQMGLTVWSGTLLPIEGWRTYQPMRNDLRCAFNKWLRESPLFDGCIDFDRAVCDASHPAAFLSEYDSGDHLHPSEKGYKAMAECALEALSNG